MKTQEALRKQVSEAHRQRFGVEPEAICYAPAAVEILGHHTDYNRGFALSCALDEGACLAFSFVEQGEAVVYAAGLREEESFNPENFRPAAGRPWAIVLKGMLKLLLGQMKSCPPFYLTYGSNVSIETGYSGLSALESAAALLVRRFLSLDISRQELVKTCQRVEADFLENPCGPLDFYTSLFAAQHALLLTDYAELQSDTVVPSERHVFLLCGTGPRRTTWREEYKKRRNLCETAAAALEAASKGGLREVSMSDWVTFRSALAPEAAARATHVIGENERARRGADLLRDGRFADFGLLMYTSHESTIRNMEDTCAEVDFIVEQSRNIPGILGARMSGGGFGGSVLVLASADESEAAMKEIQRQYAGKFGVSPTLHVIVPSSCASLYRPPSGT